MPEYSKGQESELMDSRSGSKGNGDTTLVTCSCGNRLRVPNAGSSTERLLCPACNQSVAMPASQRLPAKPIEDIRRPPPLPHANKPRDAVNVIAAPPRRLPPLPRANKPPLNLLLIAVWSFVFAMSVGCPLYLLWDSMRTDQDEQTVRLQPNPLSEGVAIVNAEDHAPPDEETRLPPPPPPKDPIVPAPKLQVEILTSTIEVVATTNETAVERSSINRAAKEHADTEDHQKTSHEIRRRVNESIEQSSKRIPTFLANEMDKIANNLDATNDGYKQFLYAWIKACGACKNNPDTNNGVKVEDLLGARKDEQPLIAAKYGIAEGVIVWHSQDPQFTYFLPVPLSDAAKEFAIRQFELTIDVLEFAKKGTIFAGLPYEVDVQTELKEVREKFADLKNGPLKSIGPKMLPDGGATTMPPQKTLPSDIAVASSSKVDPDALKQLLDSYAPVQLEVNAWRDLQSLGVAAMSNLPNLKYPEEYRDTVVESYRSGKTNGGTKLERTFATLSKKEVDPEFAAVHDAYSEYVATVVAVEAAFNDLWSRMSITAIPTRRTNVIRHDDDAMKAWNQAQREHADAYREWQRLFKQLAKDYPKALRSDRPSIRPLTWEMYVIRSMKESNRTK